MDIEIPDKLYFKIGEVAKMADVPTHVLRYWESEFAQIKPKRANSKQRLYRRQDVELILRIKTLLHKHGYTIAGAKKALKEGRGPVAAPQPIEAKKLNVTDKFNTLKKELQDIQNLLHSKK